MGSRPQSGSSMDSGARAAWRKPQPTTRQLCDLEWVTQSLCISTPAYKMGVMGVQSPHKTTLTIA